MPELKELRDAVRSAQADILTFSDNIEKNDDGFVFKDNEQRQEYDRMFEAVRSAKDAVVAEEDSRRNALFTEMSKDPYEGFKPVESPPQMQIEKQGAQKESLNDAMRAMGMGQKYANGISFDMITGEFDTSERRLAYKSHDVESRRSITRTNEYEVNTAASTRALETGTNNEGGFWVADEPMRAVEVAIKRFMPMEQAGATVYRTATGADWPIPTWDDTSNKAVIIDEEAAAANDTSTPAGQVVMNAYKYSTNMLKVSNELLEDASFPVAPQVLTSLGERAGRGIAEHTVNGDGSSKPNGVFPAADKGLGLGATNTSAPTYANWTNFVASLEPGYKSGAAMIFNPDLVPSIQQLQTTNGPLIWQPSMREGAPDRVLGIPYFESPDAPTFSTATNRFVVYGDMSKYAVRYVRQIRLLRTNDRYIENDQVGFVGFIRADGDLIDAGTHPVVYMGQVAP